MPYSTSKPVMCRVEPCKMGKLVWVRAYQGDPDEGLILFNLFPALGFDPVAAIGETRAKGLATVTAAFLTGRL